MKRRQLKAVGYRLCSVAFWDWPSGSSTDDKERVLRSVLSPHVQVLALPAPLVVLLPVKSDGSVRERERECTRARAPPGPHK